MWFKLCVLVLYISCLDAQERCSKSGTEGVCKPIRDCQPAIDDVRNRRNPQICGFNGVDPIVCCVASQAPTTTRPQPATPPPRPRPTPKPSVYVPTYEYEDENGGGCPPLPPTRAAKKNGQKAWDKCLEYQDKYVYPCTSSVGLAADTGLERTNRCGHKPGDDLILGGEDAGRKEFPHMVLLGFGDTAESAQFMCGGALISEKFILTAGHCTSTREFGSVKYAIIGALKRTDQVDSSKLHVISRIVKHPNYKPPSKYNDIALLETEKVMQLSDTVVPACVHTEPGIRDDKALAAGWGAVEYKGANANNLQKVTLQRFTTQECGIYYPVGGRLMKQGVNETTQVCYGDHNESKDTCQGDSGGPIQAKSKKMECMYVVLGITSFGKACGVIGQPGIYTRVSNFVPWIESVVWPN